MMGNNCNNNQPSRLLRGVTRTVVLTIVDASQSPQPIDLSGANVVVTVSRDGTSDAAITPTVAISGDGNNIVTFTWYPEQQQVGRYTIDLRADFGGRVIARVNWHGPTGVEIVEYSVEENDGTAENLAVNEVVEMRGVLNFGGGGGVVNAVLYVPQELNAEQQAQARDNIGAGTSDFSGNYNDLSNKPTIPAAQVNADWDAETGVARILNKPVIPNISGKADKVSNPTSGNFAGLDSLGNLTDSGSKASDFATAAQGAKADSAYQKPAGGIPAADLASGVIPTVPTISTNIEEDASSDIKTASPKAVKTYTDGRVVANPPASADNSTPLTGLSVGGINYVIVQEEGNHIVSVTTQQNGTVVFTFDNGDTTTVDLNHSHPQYYEKGVETTQPSGGFLPDKVYNLGTLTGTLTFALAAAVSGNINHYYWIFDTSDTAPTVSWPAGLSWNGGNAPTPAANKHYEISVLGGVATYLEV